MWHSVIGKSPQEASVLKTSGIICLFISIQYVCTLDQLRLRK